MRSLGSRACNAAREAMMHKALTIAPDLGGAGEAQALCATGEGDAALCERVERVLEAVAGACLCTCLPACAPAACLDG